MKPAMPIRWAVDIASGVSELHFCTRQAHVYLLKLDDPLLWLRLHIAWNTPGAANYLSKRPSFVIVERSLTPVVATSDWG
jgi:hypothetical protein